MKPQHLSNQILVFVFAGVCSICTSLSLAQQPIDFAHDILPVLKSKCAKCHTNGTFKGGLSLESRQKVEDSGTVEVGSSEDSELFRRLITDDPDERMPPEGKPLTKDEVKKFAKWIDQGMKWPVELSLAKPKFRRPLELRQVEIPGSVTNLNPVDYLVTQYFDSNNVEHPPALDDNLFVRRAKMDLLGQLPTIDELENFQRDSRADKHARLIDEFLGRNGDYADHWLSFWNDLLRNDYVGTGYIDGGRKQITGWLYESLLTNRPYDEFVQQLISPTPQSEGFIKGIKWRGRVNASQVEPLQFSQNVSQVFLGINMKCASCHDSFIDDWKLEDAYGLAAIASREPIEIHRCDVGTGKTAVSKFVFDGLGDIDDELPREKRLEQLAKLMTSKSNGRLSRTIVNRIWERFVGRGLVHPVDIMANQAWSEELLDFLARDLVEHDFDLKRTMRLIATSSLYQSKSVVVDPDDSAEFVFRGIGKKRLTAEQFVDAVWQVADSAPNSADANVSTGEKGEATGEWIWKPGAMQSPAGELVTFKLEFELESVPIAASAIVACDNSYTLFVNGKQVARGANWAKPDAANIHGLLKTGTNIIVIRGKNAGDSPNPAALFAEVLLKGSDGATRHLGTSDQWNWTSEKTNKSGQGNDVVWANAEVLSHGESVYKAADAAIAKAIGRFESLGGTRVRASLVKSDLLMRSLGRPNREQVVTTRPAELSTLQALDLSNGELLANWLRRGAKYWLNRKTQNQWTMKQLQTQLFREMLSREPSPEEMAVFEIGDEATPEDVEDLLWTVIMLPEFQFIR